jgi:PAS domain S-box-containing protein
MVALFFNGGTMAQYEGTMNNGQYKRAFGTLANDVRLDILIALRSGQKNVGELVDALRLDQSAISHGLNRLMRDGFVLVSTKGWYRYYRLRAGGFNELIKVISRFMEGKRTSAVSLNSSKNRRLYRMVDLFPYATMVEYNGTIVYLNKSGVRMFGAKSMSDLIGKEVLSLVAPRYRSIVGRRIERLRHGAKANPMLKEEWLKLNGIRFKANVVSSRYNVHQRIGAIAVIRSLV